MKLLVKIGIGVSLATNVFVFSLAIYGLLTRDARVQENRKWLSDQITQEVYKNIKLTLPPTTGKVNVGNK